LARSDNWRLAAEFLRDQRLRRKRLDFCRPSPRRREIVLGRVLLDYWNYRIDTDELQKRLKSIG
jgi:hypothetical protein